RHLLCDDGGREDRRFLGGEPPFQNGFEHYRAGRRRAGHDAGRHDGRPGVGVLLLAGGDQHLHQTPMLMDQRRSEMLNVKSLTTSVVVLGLTLGAAVSIAAAQPSGNNGGQPESGMMGNRGSGMMGNGSGMMGMMGVDTAQMNRMI